ncbi:hypothetical protein BOTNAR_0975g00010 [Botryotinia narcissicola]|uniref:Uncharacterized protein n=1 Tax=Botryotinia narcissicola TaxID=278944 RepID=A0A4Z1H650_9HELO|nr:hypothetical protein BOTNAR_0975g00010 [Botryotinia narcissicola]
MSPFEKLPNSTSSIHNTKEIPGDFSLLFELLCRVLGGIAMILMVYTIEDYRDKKRGKKILVEKELQ